MKKKCKIIKRQVIKSNNRRILIDLFTDGEDCYFKIATKRLIDRKSREITETNTNYTMESFLMLHELMKIFILDSKIKTIICDGYDRLDTNAEVIINTIDTGLVKKLSKQKVL